MTGNSDGRRLLLKSPLGDDTLPVQNGTLHAIAMQATERLSRPFDAVITVVSSERAVDPEELLFQPVCLTMTCETGPDRFINGIVRRLEADGLPRRDRWQYRLHVTPRLAFLDQTMDCRIFQQQTAVQILQTIFAEHNVDPVEFRIYGDRPAREYTTQFNETDLIFVHRLMQESGYFYYFEHSATEHRLVITDRNQSFSLLENPIHWVIHEGNNIDIFDRWSQGLRTAHGLVRLQDYDPTRPASPVLGEQATTLPTAGAPLRDVFRWPANTIENQVAADRARFSIEADEVEAGLRTGRGYDPRMMPGARFLLARDPFTGAESVDHAIHEVHHTATDDSWITGGGGGQYECRFSCLLQATPWRERLDIPRPAMAGLFSATVLGNDGEEIHADSLARIKVRLLFDRRGETVASMATWVRVAHAWAGNGWGWQHLPRVGTEVAVCFMNGDPDTPAVIGSFYNEALRPVFPVPEQQTKQGFRSRSTLRGGTQDYSELSFDDKKSAELVLLHAQKDYRTEVEHDRTIEIGRNQTVTVAQDHRFNTLNGAISISADLGSIDITAMTRLTLRVGASSITLTPEGISLEAPKVSIAAAEFNTNAASVTTDAVNVMTNAATFEVDAAAVTLATPAFVAPPPGL